MDRAELLKFLENVEAGSLEGYLSLHGDDPVGVLEERLQWAAWNFRDPEKAWEANFLMQHHAQLRAVLEEGETAWHLRLKRAEMGLPPGGTPAPVPSRVMPPPLPKDPPPPNLKGITPGPPPVRHEAPLLPARKGGPPPVPRRLSTNNSVSPHEHTPGRTVAGPRSAPPPPPRLKGPSLTPKEAPRRPQPPPSISDLAEAAAPPPLSEQATDIRVEDDPRDRWDPPTGRVDLPPEPEPARSAPRTGPAKGGKSYKRSRHMPAGLDRTIPDLDSPSSNEGLGLGILKTAYGDDDEQAPPSYRSSGDLAGPDGPPANLTYLMLGIGLAVAGFGALALAAAIVFGTVQQSNNPAPAPPTIGGALPDAP